MFVSDSIQPKLQYSTVEIFYGSRPGVRVNGNLDPELMMELSSAAPKTISDDRGWYVQQLKLANGRNLCFGAIIWLLSSPHHACITISLLSILV